MNILQFIETGGPGGAEQAVLKISKALVNDGHNVHIATLREGWLTQQIDAHGIIRTHFSSSQGFDIGLVLRIARYVKKHNIEIIHSHLLDSNTYCSLASLIAKVPCIATEHGDIHHIQKKRFSSLKVKLISKFAKKIISVSNFSKNALIAAGMRDEKIIVLGNPIDLEIRTSKYKSRSEIHPDLSEAEWLWIHVGNLRAVKDQATLIRGFALSQIENSKDHKLIIIGDGSLKHELIALAKSLKVSDNILFLGHRDDVMDILPHCDAFILSSISEALPISLLEAIRSKCIVVSSMVGGIPEVIKDKKTGYLFPQKNPKQLSLTLSHILNNVAEAKETSANAYKYVQDNFETSKVIKKLTDIYKSQR